jgi:exosortase A-associated hydrolase 2
MAALQSRRLAASGYGVLQIDLLGCGDSSGEFVDARWEFWKRDVLAAMAWLRSTIDGPVGLWGLRLGATLAAAVAQDRAAGVERLMLWQPVASGEQFLTQFLRLQLASEMFSAGAARTGVRELRAKLASDEVLEIAGYELHPKLAAAIDILQLAKLVPAVRTVAWHEVTHQPEASLTPAAQRVVDQWQAGGSAVHASVVIGEPFWATLEIAECASLLDATDSSFRA